MTTTTTTTPTPSPTAANDAAIRHAAVLIKKDRTNAQRQARYRERKRAAARAVTAVTKPRVTPPVTAPAIKAHVTVMPPERRTAPWTAALLAGIALATGALALIINGQTGWSIGTTPLAAVTFAGLALAADLLAIILPAAAVALWNGRRRLLAASAWTTWIAAASLATLATVGFVERHTADTAAGRQATVLTSTTLSDQRTAAISAAQLALTTATKQREAECQRRGPLCREREADERAALATLNNAIAVRCRPLHPSPRLTHR